MREKGRKVEDLNFPSNLNLAIWSISMEFGIETLVMKLTLSAETMFGFVVVVVVVVVCLFTLMCFFNDNLFFVSSCLPFSLQFFFNVTIYFFFNVRTSQCQLTVPVLEWNGRCLFGGTRNTCFA